MQTGFSTYFTLFLSLIFIAGLAYYSIRLLGKRTVGRSGNRLIRVVSAQALGPNKTLQVLVVDEKTVLLIGVGTGVECVARFDDGDLAAKFLRESSLRLQDQFPLPPFSWMRTLRLRKGIGTPEEGPDFSAILGEKLGVLKKRRHDAYRDLVGSDLDLDLDLESAREAEHDGGDSTRWSN